MIGGQWPQKRLFEKGYVLSPICRACSGGEGTLLHRHTDCDAWHNDRVQYLDTDITNAKASDTGGPIFWERGLFPVSRLPQ
eukprot:2637176-Heterocapsa_arctica.AAC.1